MIVALILSLPLAKPAGQAPPARSSGRDFVRNYLQRHAGLSNGEWREVLQGKPVAKTMRTTDPVDVAIYGAVRIAGSPDRLAALVRRTDEFERKMNVEQVGLMSDPPALGDLDGLTIQPGDLGDLRRCRVGDCELQMSARALERFAARVDWKSPAAGAQATVIFREMIFDALRAYRVGGIDALGAYADRDPPTAIAPEVRRLPVPGDCPVPVPRLFDYLESYPAAPPPGAESLFYWNTGSFGMKPTTRLNHIVIYAVDDSVARETGTRYVIATRQVYANHYFSATLELRTLVADDGGPEPGFFLLYATRSRVSGLTGFLGGLMRSLVKSKARSGMERFLTRTKTAIESD
jgi:hypothetical protein